MPLLVLAYPDLRASDFELIQSYRKQKDELFYNIVDPHFTIVFPYNTDNTDAFIAEVKKQSHDIKKFGFVLKCATVNKDAFENIFHTILVPDEGYGVFVRVHDKLYSGAFAPQLRYDIDYIPHIAVGNSKKYQSCKDMADEWNSKPFSIIGNIYSFTVVDYKNNMVTKIEEIKLQ